jgi:hypothetical protein
MATAGIHARRPYGLCRAVWAVPGGSDQMIRGSSRWISGGGVVLAALCTVVSSVTSWRGTEPGELRANGELRADGVLLFDPNRGS